MELKVKGNIKVKPNKGRSITIDADDLNFSEESSEEKSDGTSRTHIGKWIDGDLEIEVSIEEYPAGICNDDPLITVEGGTLIQDNLEISFEDIDTGY